MAKKVKCQLDERRFVFLEVNTDEELEIVIQMNQDLERCKARDRLYRRKTVSLDALFDDYDYEFADDQPSIIDVLVEEERNRQIRKAVQMLPKIQRYVIEQYFWEGKSLRQIARERDVNIKTVRESYHSAMAKLCVMLDGIDD